MLVTVTNDEERLLQGIRVIRRLAGAPESPWPGELAILPSGDSCVLVDAEPFGASWPGWRATPTGHVLAPLDVLRSADGHLIAFPVCRERLDDLLARRAAAGAILTSGERLTIAVSLLRGCAELAASRIGEWWVTEDARPVFAATGGGEDAIAAAARILELLRSSAEHFDRDAAALEGALAQAVETILDPSRLPRELDRLEQALFAATSPEPVALTVFAPRHARGLSVHREIGEMPDAPPPGLWASLVRHVDADLADAVSRATTGVWRRFRRAEASPARRRGPWITAGVVIAAIVGGAALVPAAADQPETVATEPAASAAPADSDASAAPESAATDDPTSASSELGAGAEGEGAAPPASVEETLSALLDARIACDGRPECLTGILADPAASVPSGAVDLPREARTVTLVDEYGDVAVLRVAPVDAPADAQFAIVIEFDGKWLLRDVHDVAEQP